MSKILTIAVREFRAIVGTKAFLISLAIMPLLMFGSFLAIELLQKSGGIDEKKIAIIDHSQVFVAYLQQAAQENNLALDSLNDSQDVAGSKAASSNRRSGPPTMAKGIKFFIENIEPSGVSDSVRLELSRRVKSHDLQSFVEIPANMLETNVAEMFSEENALSMVQSWLSDRINQRAKQLRFAQFGLDPTVVQQATMPIALKPMGLLEQNSDGSIRLGEEKNALVGTFMPMILMMLMFMVIFMSAQPMLESVLEEKSQRIAEVLLGSVSPSQLMAGKLIGSVGGSLTVVAVYILGALVFAQQKGYLEMAPLHILPWFILFQILGVMFYSSIFMAVGASVSQLKEAQSMLLPAWIVMMSPMFVWFLIIQDPNGSMAFWISMFPPATPTAMILRLSTGVSIPVWQPILGMGLLVIATIACVVIAGRIFRVGILWQGKTPKLAELARWAFTA
jgi:ABC-2 type transport system permease protein